MFGSYGFGGWCQSVASSVDSVTMDSRVRPGSFGGWIIVILGLDAAKDKCEMFLGEEIATRCRDHHWQRVSESQLLL